MPTPTWHILWNHNVLPLIYHNVNPGTYHNVQHWRSQGFFFSTVGIILSQKNKTKQVLHSLYSNLSAVIRWKTRLDISIRMEISTIVLLFQAVWKFQYGFQQIIDHVSFQALAMSGCFVSCPISGRFIVNVGLVCWSLTSLCHSNGHIETMPAR